MAIKSSMNRGLSNELKVAFPDITPAERPLVEDKIEMDPNWVAGFSSGEACFGVQVMKSETHRLGFQVRLLFVIGQHMRDEQLLRNLVKYFQIGNVYKNLDAFNFRVSKFSDIKDILIPFFLKYPVGGVKQLDFNDWCKVAELINDNAHLTFSPYPPLTPQS